MIVALLVLTGCQEAPPAEKPSGAGDTNTAPAAEIISPAGEVIREGEIPVFSAEVSDGETAGEDLVVTWASSIDGELAGTGSVVAGMATFTPDAAPSAGDHTVTLTVTDGGGLSATDTGELTVESNAGPEVAITSPLGTEFLVEGDWFEVVVEASDDADEPGEIGLAWSGDVAGYDAPTSVDSDGTATFEVTDAPAGTFTIEVTATDTEGGTGSAELVLEIAADADHDGFAAEEDGGDDCDDADAAVNPGATESCDGVDDDCDGETDEADALFADTWYADADGDGYGDEDVTTLACDQPVGYVAEPSDCDDTDTEVHPRATEVCNGVDDDCDGNTDDEAAADPSTWYVDADGDGYGDASVTLSACDQPSGYADNTDDCDDTDAAASPSATELCDAADNDCDGETDESSAADAATWYADADGDGFGDAGADTVSCAQPTGYLSDADDCDDTDPGINPDASEVCDEVDNDCDGLTDDDDGSATDLPTWYADADSDGEGDASSTVASCDQPAGYLATAGDCDDTDPAIGSSDADTWYADADGDGYGDADATTLGCTQPSGYVADSTDCDDTDAAVSPSGVEACDGVDDDCDGVVDVPPTWYADSDGDGYGDPSVTDEACEAPAGYVADDTDCDDTDADTYPGAPPQCAGDHDCDGATDSGDIAVPDDYAQLADAVSAAVDGDVICVDAGTYDGPVDFGGKELTVEGAGSDVTSIDASGGGVTMTAGSLTGFTIENGDSVISRPLWCQAGAIALDDVVFADNTCAVGGPIACYGLVGLRDCDAELTDVVFRDNSITAISTYMFGGMLYGYNADIVADGLSFEDNTVGGAGQVMGGLVSLNNSGTSTFSDVTFEGNTVSTTGSIHGGMWYLSATQTDISGLVMRDNVVVNTNGIVVAGMLRQDWGTVDIEDAEVTGNSMSTTHPSGGVYGLFLTEATLTFEDLYASDNTLSAYAVYGGIGYVSDGYLAFSHSRIVDNELVATRYLYGGIVRTYTDDGGLVLDISNTIVAGNTISAPTVYGGAVAGEILGSPSATLALSFVDLTGNEVSASTLYGGLFYSEVYSSRLSSGFDLDMVNVVDNSVSSTTYYGSVFYDSSVTLDASDWDYCNVYGNGGTAFYNATDPTGSSGNLAVDPLYSDTTASAAADWDLTLQSTSPVIDAGDPSSAYDDADGSTADIGAYGGPSGAW